MPSDKDLLIEMGFPELKVLRALRETKNSGLQPAIDWLDIHADDPDEPESSMELPATVSDDTTEKNQDTCAHSLLCNDCGKLLKNAETAELHAVRTGHQSFSESTEQIKPLTEEEKAEKLKFLEERLAAKKKAAMEREKLEKLENEKIRRKAGKDLVKAKAELEEREMSSIVEAKRREKEEDRAAKERIRALIEQDKLERKKKAQHLQPVEDLAIKKPLPSAPVVQKDYATTRIQIRQQDGPVLTETFHPEDKLQAVYNFVAAHRPAGSMFKLMMTFPRKELSGADLNKSLKELNLIPSAALAVMTY